MAKSLSFPDLDVEMIDEDPRLRHRTVPMKVLVLGYPRTGTSCRFPTHYYFQGTSKAHSSQTAIQKALEILGYGPCYHMRTAVNEYPRDCELWLDAFRAKYDGVGVFEKEQWDQLLGRYSVRVANPLTASFTEFFDC